MLFLNSVGKRDGKKPPGKLKRVCYDIIKMYFAVTGAEKVYWIRLLSAVSSN